MIRCSVTMLLSVFRTVWKIYSVVTWNVHITNSVSFNDMIHIFIKHQVHSIITGVLAEALFHRRAVLGCNRPLSISETIRVDQSPNTP